MSRDEYLGSRFATSGTEARRYRPTTGQMGATLLALALLAGCAGKAGAPVETQAGPYTLTATLRPDPPSQSGGSLLIEVANDAGDAVTGADLSVGYFMPAMGTMAEMKSDLEVEEKADGVYVADLDLPMGGSWRIDVAVDAPPGRATAAYGLTVGAKGLRLQESSSRTDEVMADADAGHGPSHGHEGEDGVAYYTCSMHPSVRSQDPGQCPICSMDLVPVTEQEIETGTIRIDPARRQEIGVRTEVVAPRPMTTTVRAVGRVTYDETLKSDVSLKIGGWIGRLNVNEPGQRVRRGQTLFTLYSPDLYAAQQEYLTVLASQRSAADTAAPTRADYLVDAARQRLRLWDLSPAQIDSLAESGEPLQYLPILSPASGYVVEKNVVEGAAVKPGERLFRIAGLDRVWVEAEVFEAELPLIELGQRANITLPYVPGRTFEGEVAFIYPYLEGDTRTGRVRIELPNPDLELKPDMYANVTIERDLGERLTVPDEAVLYAGERSFVFIDLGDGRLQPHEIETGVTTEDRTEILSGLQPGSRVVTSGNFLVAAEARLKLALEQWR